MKEKDLSCHQHLLVAQLLWELVNQPTQHRLKHSKLEQRMEYVCTIANGGV